VADLEKLDSTKGRDAAWKGSLAMVDGWTGSGLELAYGLPKGTK